MQAPKNFYHYSTGIYSKDASESVGYNIIRVVGWQTINNKVHWVFSYTFSRSWGLFNYGLIEQGAWDVDFYVLNIVDK